MYCETCRGWTSADVWPNGDAQCGECGDTYTCGECGHEVDRDGSCLREGGCLGAAVVPDWYAVVRASPSANICWNHNSGHWVDDVPGGGPGA